MGFGQPGGLRVLIRTGTDKNMRVFLLVPACSYLGGGLLGDHVRMYFFYESSWWLKLLSYLDYLCDHMFGKLKSPV